MSGVLIQRSSLLPVLTYHFVYGFMTYGGLIFTLQSSLYLLWRPILFDHPNDFIFEPRKQLTRFFPFRCQGRLVRSLRILAASCAYSNEYLPFRLAFRFISRLILSRLLGQSFLGYNLLCASKKCCTFVLGLNVLLSWQLKGMNSNSNSNFS